MLHLDSLDQADFKNTWVTIGSFDGVHRGHQAIIQSMVSSAHAVGAEAVVLTFHPHPAVVLGRREKPYCLTTPEERAILMGQLGVDVVITQTFDQALANTSARGYLARLSSSLNMRMLWVGHDFTLGHNREGNITAIRNLGEEMDFEVRDFDAVRVEGQIISSSQVRQIVRDGNVRQAAIFLGRPYSLEGIVVKGDQRGRTIGIPTANLSYDAEKLIPLNGVYACRVSVSGQAWPAATNIGVRPTFDGQSSFAHVEAHLINYQGNLYNQRIKLEFIERLRDEQRFNGIEALVAQIHLDIAQTLLLVQPVY